MGQKFRTSWCRVAEYRSAHTQPSRACLKPCCLAAPDGAHSESAYGAHICNAPLLRRLVSGSQVRPGPPTRTCRRPPRAHSVSTSSPMYGAAMMSEPSLHIWTPRSLRRRSAAPLPLPLCPFAGPATHAAAPHSALHPVYLPVVVPDQGR